jgi:hypothetical protein
VVNAAVLQAGRLTGRDLANYEFCLAECEQNLPVTHDHRCLHFRLGDDLLRRKLQAAHDYLELQEEVRRGIAQRGREYFQVECLRKMAKPDAISSLGEKPFYEICGEQRVAGGAYESVIRYREHVLPIMQALREHALAAKPAAALRHAAS